MSAPVSSSVSVAIPPLPAPVCYLRDELLDVSRLGGCNLYLAVGPAGVRVGVVDVRRNKFVVLEDYATQTGTAAIDVLRALSVQHDLVGQPGWNQVRLTVQNRAFTLLPTPLFSPGDESTYLRLHHALDPAHEAVGAYRHAGLDVVSVFAVDKPVADWLGTTYPAARLVHHTSALLEGVVHQTEAGGPRRTYLNVGPQELTVLVVRNKRPEFCNVFAFTTPEDLIYYTILVMQELQLNPDQDPVVVWGDLTHDSELFTILRKYIRHVRFGNRPFDLSYSYRLNDVFEYRYFDLYSLHFCE